MEKRKHGDRRDGRRIRNLDGLHCIMLHLMPRRTEAEVYLEHSIDVTELMDFVARKNSGNADYKTTVFHCVVAGIGRVVQARPYLNRFVCGRKLYARNEITLSFVAKRKFQDHAEESLMTITAHNDTNLTAISRKITGDVEQLRHEKGSNDFDAIIDRVGHLPGPILHLFIGLLQRLSAIGCLPAALTQGDTNHTTVLLSNLGSIQCDCCYHHLNNYGTNSIMVTVGVIRDVPQLMEDGSVSVRKIMKLGFTADERIADGFYFAKSLKLLEYLLTHPQLLEVSLGEEIAYDL